MSLRIIIVAIVAKQSADHIMVQEVEPQMYFSLFVPCITPQSLPHRPGGLPLGGTPLGSPPDPQGGNPPVGDPPGGGFPPQARP